MQGFEKEYRARFKTAEDRSGIDENQLWEAIAADLPPAAQGEVRKSRFWIILPFIFGLSCLFGDWPVQSQGLTSAQEVVHAPASLKPETRAEQLATASLITAPPATTAPPTDHPEMAVTSMRPATFDQASSIATSSTSTLMAPESLAPGEGGPAEKKTILHQAAVAPLKGANIPLLVQQERLFAPRALMPAIIENTSLISSSEKSLSWGIQAGVFRMEEQFSKHETATGYNQTLGNAHAADGGYQLGVSAHFPIGQTFTLNTGLSYNAHYATFDWTTSRDTVIWRDNQPGGELVNAIADRRVRHQQALQWLSLPLSLGIESQHQRLSLGVQAGLGLNYLITQSGRSINENGQFITYSSDSEAANPFNNFFLSSHLGLQLGYQLQDGLELMLQPRLAYQVHGQSAAYKLKHSSTIFGINLGLVWK